MNEITMTNVQKVLATVLALDVNGAPATANNIVWSVSDPSLLDIVEVQGVPTQKTLFTKGVDGVCEVLVTAIGKDGVALSVSANVNISAVTVSEAVSLGITFGTPELI